MSSRGGINQMRFCECKHGQSAHRNGLGVCFGERMVKGVWTSCTCTGFRAEQPQPDAPDEGYDDEGYDDI